MRKSELILPLRIYDDLYDQFRFNRNCGDDDKCEQALNFASNALPYFQFNRTSSANSISSLIMRNVCYDENGRAYKCVNPEAAENFVPGPGTDTYWDGFPKIQGFTFNDHINPPFGFDENIAQLAECGGIESNIDAQLNDLSNTTIAGPVVSVKVGFILGVGLKHRLKIVVPELVIGGGSSFSIKVYNGTSSDLLLLTITQPGVYVVEFIGWYNDVNIYFPNIQTGDYYRIKSVSCTRLTPTTSSDGGFDGDVDMDETKVNAYQKIDGQDVIIYCEGASPQNYKPKPGDYYYVIQFGPNEIYYSEIFSVKDSQELESYYKLRWLNSACDINNAIIYTPATYSGICDGYFNEIYLPSELFEPQYETNEEIVENGQGDKNITFKRWQKSIKLEVMKSAPYLTDALSGIFLHDTITLTDPLQNQQQIRGDAYNVERVSSEVTDIFYNCYQGIKVILFLPSRYTGTNCCNSAEFFECPQSFPPSPTITSITEPSPHLFIIEGTAYPGSIAVIEYNLNSAGYVRSEFAQALVDADGNYTIVLDADWISASITDLDIHVIHTTNICGDLFGATANQDII